MNNTIIYTAEHPSFILYTVSILLAVSFGFTQNEVIMLLSNANPQEAGSLRNLQMDVKQQATDESRKDAKSLTKTYTSKTSIVAILIATITFAAAFTLPGGYSSDAGSEGLPIMSKKFAFQTFLIFDVLAMCSSFAVAFIGIIARWGDYEFLLHYTHYTPGTAANPSSSSAPAAARRARLRPSPSFSDHAVCTAALRVSSRFS